MNHGTRPLDDLYFELRARLVEPRRGRLRGADRRPAAEPSPAIPTGRYQLFRIGDAVAARNTHAAIYDALRLARTI